MKYANAKYITIKHPVTGYSVYAIPTGKIRQGQSPLQETEAEVRIITPGAHLDIYWITKSNIIPTQ